MRLLDTSTGQFVSKDPEDPETNYAILSHTWDPQGEQTYQELREIQKRYSSEYRPSPSTYSPDVKLSRVLSPVGQSPAPTERTLSAVLVPPVTPASTDRGLPTPLQRIGGVITVRDRLAREPSSRSFVQLDAHTFHAPLAIGSSLPRYSPDPTPRSVWDDPQLSPKIRGACAVARANGYRYIWIDSCCIDKASSSELSEAINSMYRWYARAEVCYVFLADVPAEEDPQLEDSCFRRSRWFSRGWTLQELIAPHHVVFLSKDWVSIGSKRETVDLVFNITTISPNALLHVESLDKFSVAQRLSWASERETTRVEDRAYSLLGIFDINMATLYGEGDRAFRRLQEEIMRQIPDQSLFAWGKVGLPHGSLDGPRAAEPPQCFDCHRGNPGGGASLLAASPSTFRNGLCIEADSHEEVFRRLHRLDLSAPDYDFTPHGIRTKVPVIRLSDYLPAGATSDCPENLPLSQWYLVILGCHHQADPWGHLLGRICYIPPSQSGVDFLYSGWAGISPRPPGSRNVFDLFPISQETIERLWTRIEIKRIYIPHPERAQAGRASEVACRRPHQTIRLVLDRPSCDALRTHQGYAATLQGPDQVHPTTHELTLLHLDHYITVDFSHQLLDDGKTATIFATRVKVSGRLLCFSHCNLEIGDAARWEFHKPWNNQRWTEQVELDIGATRRRTLDLTLDFATQDHYLLYVDVRPSRRSTDVSVPPADNAKAREARRTWTPGTDTNVAPVALYQGVVTVSPVRRHSGLENRLSGPRQPTSSRMRARPLPMPPIRSAPPAANVP